MLRADDPALITWLNTKDSEWAETQTVPPTNLQVTSITAETVQLGWIPIRYTGDSGYYQISVATSPDGPYTIHGTTSNKSASTYLVNNLNPNTTYYFVVRSFTAAHDDQQNDLLSEPSVEISATTLQTGTATATPTPTPSHTPTPTPTPPVGCEQMTIMSTGSGSWDSAANWSPSRVPTASDVVWVQAGHTVTVPRKVTVQGLCNEGTLSSLINRSLEFVVSESVINYTTGQMVGRNGSAGSGSQCGTAGSTIRIAPPRGDDGVAITNRGRIVAGHGGDGNRCAGKGGSTYLFGRNTTNSGFICAGHGGNVLGSDARGAEGGETHVWGKWRGAGDLSNRGEICAGNGGNGIRGGNGGRLKLISLPNVDLAGGIHTAGKGGQGSTSGSNGRDGRVIIEPKGTINLSGARVEGGEILIFGGDDWVLDLSSPETSTVISATEGITLAVGAGGSIDLRNSQNLLIQANEEVVIASDNIQLDAGVELTDVINAPTVMTETARLLRDVSLAMPNVAVANPGTAHSVNLTILNNGPATDSYEMNITGPAGWKLSGQPTGAISIEGLSGQEVELNITPPQDANDGDRGLIEIQLTSQGDNTTVTDEIEIVIEAEEKQSNHLLYLPLVIR